MEKYPHTPHYDVKDGREALFDEPVLGIEKPQLGRAPAQEEHLKVMVKGGSEAISDAIDRLTGVNVVPSGPDLVVVVEKLLCHLYESSGEKIIGGMSLPEGGGLPVRLKAAVLARRDVKMLLNWRAPGESFLVELKRPSDLGPLSLGSRYYLEARSERPGTWLLLAIDSASNVAVLSPRYASELAMRKEGRVPSGTGKIEVSRPLGVDRFLLIVFADEVKGLLELGIEPFSTTSPKFSKLMEILSSYKGKAGSSSLRLVSFEL